MFCVLKTKKSLAPKVPKKGASSREENFDLAYALGRACAFRKMNEARATKGLPV